MDHGIGFGEALRVWTRIALMHHVLVEEKRWIGEARFLHASISVCSCRGRRRSSLPSLHYWFAGTTPGPLALEMPDLRSADWRAILLSGAALVAAFRFQVGVPALLAGSAVAGFAITSLA